MEIAVVLHERHDAAEVAENLLDSRGGMQRTTELQGLRGIHQLDCEYLLCILDNPDELRCGVGAHTDVVLLSLRRRNGIRAGREAEALALADNGGRRILRNHKAAVQSRFRHQERR